MHEETPPATDHASSSRLVLGFGLALAPLALVGCQVITGPFGGSEKLELAFEGRPHCNFDLFRVRADGSGLQELTSGTVDEFDPTWSPDGQRLAYLSSEGVEVGYTGIHVMKADGTDRTLLTDPSVHAFSPAWSPDGTHIAFVSNLANPDSWDLELYLMRPDGSDIRRITFFTEEPGLEMGGNPRWNPDGRRILFAVIGGHSEGGFIYVADIGDGTVRNLTPGSAADHRAAWSPDGDRIVFGRYRIEEDRLSTDLFLMDADGSNVERISDTPDRGEFDPAWSPDGRRLAYRFVVDEPDGPQWGWIEVFDLTTGTSHIVRGLTDGGGVFAWSPDGGKLAVGYTLGLDVVEVGGSWGVDRIWSFVPPRSVHLPWCPGGYPTRPVWRPQN